MVVGEVCGAPAVYGRADVLSGGDEHGTERQERDGVAVMQSVDEVVVVARVQPQRAPQRHQPALDHLSHPSVSGRRVLEGSAVGRWTRATLYVSCFIARSSSQQTAPDHRTHRAVRVRRLAFPCRLTPQPIYRHTAA